MSLLRHALKLVSPPQAPMPRQRLRAALTARARAEVELQEAHAGVARVENLVTAARAADRHARSARAEASTAAKQWAASGADPNAAQYHEQLAATALDAERAADGALTLADAAAAGLGTVKEAATNRQAAVARAIDEVREATGMILVDRIAPQSEALQRAAAEYAAARLEVMALYRLVYSMRKRWRDDATHESSEAAKFLRTLLDETAISELDENSLRALTAERTADWRRLAEQLRSNPDAPL